MIANKSNGILRGIELLRILQHNTRVHRAPLHIGNKPTDLERYSSLDVVSEGEL